MIIKYLFLFIASSLFTIHFAAGQTIGTKEIRGIYTTSTGVPGRKQLINDSTTISVLPKTYTSTSLILKRFGRVRKIYKNYYAGGLDSDDKGKWKLEGDTLYISMLQHNETYTIDQPGEGGVMLRTLSSDSIVYVKEE